MSAPVGVVPHPDAIGAVLALVRPGLDRLEADLANLAETDDPILAPMLSTVLPGSTPDTHSRSPSGGGHRLHRRTAG